MNDEQEITRARKLGDADLVHEIKGTPIYEHPLVHVLVERFEIQPQRGVCKHCGGAQPKVRNCKYCDGTGIDLT